MKKLSDDQIPRIAKMLEAGLTASEIAEAIGFSKDTIRSFIRRHKLRK